MKYLSVCSGIEAATVAWHPLGWTAAAFSEIEPFPSAVLAHHYPDVPNLGDMSGFQEWNLGTVDLLVGGTPCQSFSVAGLRKGLDDPRGNLLLTYLAIAARRRPRWLVWENVPGVLSSNDGRDFGALLGGLAELGYGFAYRVLDAQFFGVPQRRRRVFVVGCLGDWRRAAAVLFERHSLSGNPPPRRQAREDAAATVAGGARKRGGFTPHVAGTLRAGSGGGCGPDADDAKRGLLIAFDGQNIGDCCDVAATIDSGSATNRGIHVFQPIAFGGNNTTGPINVATALNACSSASGRMDFESETFVTHALTGEGFDASEDGTGRGTTQHASASDLAPSLQSTNPTAIASSSAVRRLTPRECARLQGFPDDYLDIAFRGKPAADGNKYKALGNSMAVPVMAWIGRRIAMVNALGRLEEYAA